VQSSSGSDQERVTVENGRLRLTALPGQLGRVVALAVRSEDGTWVDQLYASEADAGIFGWFNPWYGGIHTVLTASGRRDGGGGGQYPGVLAKETFTWSAAERTGSQGNRWQGIAVSAETAKGAKGTAVDTAYLTIGRSNVLAVVSRVENRSPARFGGSFSLNTFLAPGGDRTAAVLHYLRSGERTQKRVHGGVWSSSEQWCAVEPPTGPVIAVVSASPELLVEPRDMGMEGIHPAVSRRIDLEPGQAIEATTYLVFADGIEQARLYRQLARSGGLV
jgi:hypothetical protein